MSTIGKLSSGKLLISWKIPNIASLSYERDIYYESPTFYFLGAAWNFRIFPNGETGHNSQGHIGIYLAKIGGLSLTVDYSFKLRSDVRGDCRTLTGTNTFGLNDDEWGCDKFISRSDLLKRMPELGSHSFTIDCSITGNTVYDLFSRAWGRAPFVPRSDMGQGISALGSDSGIAIECYVDPLDPKPPESKCYYENFILEQLINVSIKT